MTRRAGLVQGGCDESRQCRRPSRPDPRRGDRRHRRGVQRGAARRSAARSTTTGTRSGPWPSVSPGADAPLDVHALQAPVPRPRQVFAIGLNYAAHAAEAGLEQPTFPPTFTKFPTCLTGPDATVELPSEFVDWEVELVVVIGRLAYEVAAGDGWRHVAGLTVGQDLSERIVQTRPPAPAVQPRQVVPRVRADRAVGRHPRRARQPRRPRPRLHASTARRCRRAARRI